MKRIFLLIVTNFAVLAVLGVTMQLLGIDRMLAQDTGLNLTGLLLMAALFGFGGSFISLLISKWMAKMATGAHVIEAPSNATERWLVDTVKRQADKSVSACPRSPSTTRPRSTLSRRDGTATARSLLSAPVSSTT